MADEIFSSFDQHNHDGLNSTKINPSNMLGYRVTSTAPTAKANEGTLILANESGTYKIYAYINGGWRSATLT
jgi:hypothetical protein